MWTWEVSAATKRMSRVHCWKAPSDRDRLSDSYQKMGQRGRTTLIGVMLEDDCNVTGTSSFCFFPVLTPGVRL